MRGRLRARRAPCDVRCSSKKSRSDSRRHFAAGARLEARARGARPGSARLSQPHLPRRVPARLSQRIRALYAASAARAAARPGRGCCRGPRTHRTRPTSGATAAISCCASCGRTWRASGVSSTGRRAAIRICASVWRKRWWAGRRTANRLTSARHDERLHLRGRSAGLALPAGRAHPADQSAQCGSAARRAWNPLASWRMLGFDAAALEQDLVASTRFHRLLRRGRKYGVRGRARSAARIFAADIGIHFICLAANIKRQFEFVQSAWLIGSKFAGLTGESDPLLGPRVPDSGGFPDRRFLDSASRGSGSAVERPAAVRYRGGGAYFSCPAFAPCVTSQRRAERGRDAKERAGFDDEPSGAACQHRLCAPRLDQRYVRATAAARAAHRSVDPSGLRCGAARSDRAPDHGADQPAAPE